MSVDEEEAKSDTDAVAITTLVHADCNVLDKVNLKNNLAACLAGQKQTILLPELPGNRSSSLITAFESDISEGAEEQLVTDIAAVATVATDAKQLHPVPSTVSATIITLQNDLNLADSKNNVESNANLISSDNDDITTSSVTEVLLSLPASIQTMTTTAAAVNDKTNLKCDQLDNKRSVRLSRKYQCHNCSKSFSRGCDLQRHERVHTGEKPYKCHYCTKAFSQSGTLSAHLRLHTGKQYECRYCCDPFPQRSELLEHIKLKHSRNTSLECKFCQKLFTSLSTMTIHVRTHTGEKPFTCHLCPKSFAHKSDRTKHIRSHTGEKPFQCLVCRKSFSRSTSLKVHQRIHTGETPFKCFYCMKTFSCSSYLTKHIRTHTGEKPFMCKHCDKSFRVSSHLARHIRGHSNLKGFDHKYCKKSSSSTTTTTTITTTVTTTTTDIASISTPLISPLTVTVLSTPYTKQDAKQTQLTNQSHLLIPPLQTSMEVTFSQDNTVNLSNDQQVQTLQEIAEVQAVQTTQPVPGVQVMDIHYAREGDEVFNSGTIVATNDDSHEGVSTFVFEDPNQISTEVTCDYFPISTSDGNLMLANHSCSRCGQTFLNGSVYRVHLRSHQQDVPIINAGENERFFHYNCCQRQIYDELDF